MREGELKKQQIKQEIKRGRSSLSEKYTRIKSELKMNEFYSLDLAAATGASRWLSAMPFERYHFELTKSEFRNVIDLAMAGTQ